ncbi:hypothetical protein [Aestuariivirga sp.]|uniref:hypothetical protein n=1 Tax=Aestuariivirga sp. TaxID=2650926 RepID=UPI003BAB0801
MKLVEVVILVGSQCLSPLQHGDGITDAGKVHCAVLIRQDAETGDIEIIPRSAATDPDVIAMLVKPRAADAPDDVTGSLTVPRAVPRMAAMQVLPAGDEEVDVAVPTPKPDPAPRKRVSSARRTDACGSYRAVWYTNKSGHRKYRCVKAS